MNVDWERFTIHTEDPFRISRGVRTQEERVWLRVEADGVEGWGEADPSAYYGETADTVEAAFEKARPLLERTTDAWSLERLDEDLREPFPKDGSARAAVSTALHDLIGKRLGQPLWRVWGLDPAAAPLSSFTIGIDEPEEVAAKVRRAHEYPVLKIKVGTDRDEELLERSPLPIILDESCIVASDIPGLVGFGHGINIKLAKCGGPREAFRMIHTARACDLLVMMGCMLETTLGIAPAAHLAPLVDYADLDGAALLRDDPFEGPAMQAGRILLGDAPGLGVSRLSEAR
jgi:L-alanine-DL-glutamate epimerase-like enolase superfamily enzyme